MTPEELRDADVAHEAWKRARVAAGAVKAVAAGYHGTWETHAYRIHDLRHSFGHHVGAAPAIAPHAVRDVMGHTNL